MKITIEYDSEEDALLALSGWKKQAAIEEVGNEVFRPARKHGYADDDINKILAHLDSLCEESKTGEGLWASDLIYALELKYWGIINGSDT